MKEEKGLRFNNGKTRYDLLEPHAIEELAKVFTKGAEKYEPNNWLRGMAWSKMLASLKRHIAKFEKGEDYDEESGLLHMSHAAWNALGLVSYYKYHPEHDDRLQMYKFKKKIGLDIDGVLADFQGGINKISGIPDYKPADWDDPLVSSIFKDIKYDESFWLNLEPLITPEELPLEPHCYITSRSIDAKVTKAWLDKYGFPDVPVYSLRAGESKVETAIKSGIDYFIDDYYKNFLELNKAGVCTFLMDASYNKKYNVGYKRIKDFNDFKERFI